jgi:hypothetical protein
MFTVNVPNTFGWAVLVANINAVLGVGTLEGAI